ncbi:MAG: hypothetical protein A2086_02885 [Spirochaetes bacterium GWD1_27_9]|nr:MAG: hypothetical protein A2Z98_18570 [Spirochaetes bacterium GWB1_27_13]OHD20226.1 MAG: hypothetical protein A2Y34_04810 [Spirochaetes bacterium GWC1_27_15]OHD43663.1 MAG: hypothetical protein A2086_02885 [Spirochaetes bacterium GWD1_27_9]
MIEKYFIEIENILLYFQEIIIDYSVEKKIYSQLNGYINIKVSFKKDFYLEITEVKDITKKEKIKYSYHFMDKNNNLIFRYDNAKHHKKIKTFPDHKHTEDKITESKEPELFTVLIEIYNFITKL